MGGLVLGVLAATAFGSADFLGGVAARRSSALMATVIAQIAGFAVVAPLLALQPAPAEPSALAWGALAGLAGCLGLVVFFRALADGSMSSSAPVTAVIAAGLPIAAGVLLGERPAVQGWLGGGAGLLAVGLLSPAPDRESVG